MAQRQDATREAGRNLAAAITAIEEHGPLSQQATDAMRGGAFAEIHARQQGATTADIYKAAEDARR